MSWHFHLCYRCHKCHHHFGGHHPQIHLTLLQKKCNITAIHCVCDAKPFEWHCHDGLRDSLPGFQHPCTYNIKLWLANAACQSECLALLCQTLFPHVANKEFEWFVDADIKWLKNTSHPIRNNDKTGSYWFQFHISLSIASKCIKDK